MLSRYFSLDMQYVIIVHFSLFSCLLTNFLSCTTYRMATPQPPVMNWTQVLQSFVPSGTLPNSAFPVPLAGYTVPEEVTANQVAPESEKEVSASNRIDDKGRSLEVTISKRPGQSWGLTLAGPSTEEDKLKNIGVVITNVKPGGAAAEAGGIVSGSRIVAVDGKNTLSSTKGEIVNRLKSAENSITLSLEQPVSGLNTNNTSSSLPTYSSKISVQTHGSTSPLEKNMANLAEGLKVLPKNRQQILYQALEEYADRTSGFQLSSLVAAMGQVLGKLTKSQRSNIENLLKNFVPSSSKRE